MPSEDISEIKIATYNIEKCQKPKEILRNIKKLADTGVKYFCLQEVWPPKQGEKFLVETLLEELGDDWQAEYILSAKRGSFDYGLCALWQSSLLKPVVFHQLPLPKIKKAKLWEKLFALFLGHTASPVQRGALIGTFEIGNKKIRITCAHLDWQGGFEQRGKQMAHLKNFLDKDGPVDYEIICGDLNTVGFIDRVSQPKKIGKLLGPQFKNASTRPITTITSRQHLDHIFTKGLTPRHTRSWRWSGSDHYPLTTELVFENKA